MDSWPVTVALPMVLALIMFGLGLALTADDFTRVVRYPRAVVVALTCQLVVLPAIAFGLVIAVGLGPAPAVGVMLLMASPGGATANLLSHLFRGDVALNVTLTAVNSVLSVLTLPLVTNFALGYFAPPGADGIGLQFGKVAQVFALVLIPVAAGMVARRLRPGFADRMDRPVRIVSVAFLAVVTLAALVAERGNVLGYLAAVGLVVALLCVTSLGVGYFVPKAFGVTRSQAIACSMEVGIHNSALAMTIAISVLGDIRMAVPAGVYGIVMLPIAYVAGSAISRRIRREETVEPAVISGT
ncbi:bile acid:Na+ symporter, BASS family [Nocardia amikacinitolerans]|uniref:Bile acid:Na+ symporter, BASS family n=1 Tax=Nocardia amikacinitolerans TaxID=756689 RepID=A0A285LTQ5_9NOCA|nr:bile acid:sodium symporter family protein [Nocardia amikacinitolerans]MCP2297102.1 bile acid:Na+ symporter, BASS family [Nocardia amikacinitolerans]SNY88299.1 bile acid:Na+ symporter, BASS family [Nocardia amikacinitolerans]